MAECENCRNTARFSEPFCGRCGKIMDDDATVKALMKEIEDTSYDIDGDTPAGRFARAVAALLRHQIGY